MGGRGRITQNQPKIAMEISYSCFIPELGGFYSRAEEMFQLSFENVAAGKISKSQILHLFGKMGGRGDFPGVAGMLGGRKRLLVTVVLAPPHPEQRDVAPIYIRVLYIERFAADFNGNRMLSICPREYFWRRCLRQGEGRKVEKIYIYRFFFFWWENKNNKNSLKIPILSPLPSFSSPPLSLSHGRSHETEDDGYIITQRLDEKCHNHLSPNAPCTQMKQTVRDWQGGGKTALKLIFSLLNSAVHYANMIEKVGRYQHFNAS